MTVALPRPPWLQAAHHTLFENQLRSVMVGTGRESGDEKMGAKLAVAVAVLLVSIPSLAPVQPAATEGWRLPVKLSVGAGMDYIRAIGKLGTLTGGGPAPGLPQRFGIASGSMRRATP